MSIDTSPDPNWMEKAVKRPGALKKKAKSAGMSTSKFASKNDKGNSRTAKQSRLAETFAKMRSKK